MFQYVLGPKRTWLNSNIRSNERTFKCSLRNSNFAINSMWKCALISKVEKWHPHFKKWLQMLPVQVIWVNLCPWLNKLWKTMKKVKQKVFLQTFTGRDIWSPWFFSTATTVLARSSLKLCEHSYFHEIYWNNATVNHVLLKVRTFVNFT